MRILFFPYACFPFHGLSLNEQFLGRTETIVLRMAEALDALGHEVIVISSLSSIPLTKPRYLPLSSLNQIGWTDLLIVARSWRGSFSSVKCKKRVVWMLNGEDDPYTVGIGDHRIIELLNGALFPSQWEARCMAESSGFPMEKSHVIRCGIHLADFSGEEIRQHKRLICKGAVWDEWPLISRLFEKLRKKHPELELHIFPQGEELKMDPPQMHGCFIHETLLQKQMAREWMKSSISIDLSQNPSKVILSAMEAQAAGCAVVATKLEGVEEVMGEAGILIEGNPGEVLYRDQWIEKVDLLLSDEKEWRRLSQNGLQKRYSFDWKSRGIEFLHLLKDKFGLE